jgi:hypothetical protein
VFTRCAFLGAPFLLQKDGFSCHESRSFPQGENRKRQQGQGMCDGGGSATPKSLHFRQKFTVAMKGAPPYAQQIVNEQVLRRRKFFRLIYRQSE